VPFDLDAHAALLAAHLTVIRPPGPGPFPVAVQMHGCGGLQPMQMRYAETARAAGFATVVVDSLAPRRIGKRAAQFTVCTGLRLRGAERAIDLLAILHWLRAQPWADADHVVAAGWSHGGWAIMEAMAGSGANLAPPGLLDAVKAVVLVYPYAGPPARTRGAGWGTNRPKVYGLLAGRDAVVGTKAPGRALDRLAEDGLAVEVLTLAEATHCFDEDTAEDPRTRYSADQEAQAQAFYAKALRSSVAAAPGP
jgi:dienelactone hydrolase